MYSLVFFLPIILLSLIILFSRLLGNFYISIFVIFITFLLFIFSLFIFYEVCICGINCNIIFFKWLYIDTLSLNFEFYFDFLSSFAFLMIIFISLMVYLYSIEYMYHDPFYIRFLFYLVLFTFFMIILIFSSNFLQLFLGWEGVGVVSYLLINFWYTRVEANRAAIKAILVNKVGDVFLYFSIILSYYFFKSLDFSLIFMLTPFIYNYNNYFLLFDFTYVYIIDFICFFIFLAVVGKSAQLGLHVWLADAMEGPTPVSALLHAATMVTAGVFLLIRFSPLFEFSNILILIMIWGSVTCLASSFIGLVQFDIKKIIAYSTCSQLGYMVFICGVSGYNYALFHMFNHAFFKALLFLLAGGLITIFNGEQDIRKMFVGFIFFPYFNLILLMGSSALIGLPFFSAFYSKDLILENVYFSFTISGFYVYWLGLVTVICTFLYSIKIFYWIFLNNFNNNFLNNSKYFKNIYETKFFINFVLILLLICSLITGYVFYDLLAGSGTDLIFSSIFIKSYLNSFNFFEIIPWYIKIIPLLLTFTGFLFSYVIFQHVWKLFIFTNFFYKYLILFKKKIYFDLFIFYAVNLYIFFIYDILYKVLDKGLFNFLGPRGISFYLKSLWLQFIKKETGFMITYIDGLLFYSFIYIFILYFLIILSYNVLLILFYIYLFLYIFNNFGVISKDKC